MKLTYLMLAVPGVLAGYATGASAQETAPAAAIPAQSGQDDQTGLADIIVTATRRESNLQTTPIAVSALGADQIAQQSPRDIGDLAAFVPGFSAAKTVGYNAAAFSMRGTGANNVIIYYESPVSVLVDDFVIPSVQTQLLDTFDLEQIEVLRGPQGTLFGKNTTGGAVNARTKRPDLNKLSSEVRASYGSFNTFRGQAAINVPIINDQLALRVVASYNKSDGYYHEGACSGPLVSFRPSKFAGLTHCGDGRAAGGEDVFYVRGKLLWEPSDQFSTLLQGEYMRDRSDVVPIVNETPVGDMRFASNVFGTIAGTGDPLNLAENSHRSGYTVDLDKGTRLDVRGVYSNTDIKLDAGTITNVIGYRYQKSRLPQVAPGGGAVAADGETFSFFDYQRADDRKTFQEELRFASAFSGPFQFVAGAFYQHESVKFVSQQVLGFLDLSSPPTPYGPWNTTPYPLANAQKSSSTAIYAEGNYKLAPELTLTLGARYTRESKTFKARQQGFIQDLTGVSDPNLTWQDLGLLDEADFTRFPVGVITNKKTYSAPTWRASLGWQASKQVFVYGTYARGFKGSGYNDQVGTFAPFQTLAAFQAAANPTRPEKADSFELGVKTETADHRARLNVTAFYVKYRDLQRQVAASIDIGNGNTFQTTKFFNAASARVQGIEAEAAFVPIEGLTLGANASYQDGKYLKYVSPVPAGHDLATDPLDRTPKWQWNINANYSTPLTSGIKFTIGGNVEYTGRNLFAQSLANAADTTYLEARTLANASIGISDPDDRYSLRVVGRNLADKRYHTGYQVVDGFFVQSAYGAPRYVAVELGAKF